jgi:hypothetical protein
MPGLYKKDVSGIWQETEAGDLTDEKKGCFSKRGSTRLFKL